MPDIKSWIVLTALLAVNLFVWWGIVRDWRNRND